MCRCPFDQNPLCFCNPTYDHREHILSHTQKILIDEQKCRQMKAAGFARDKPRTLMRLFHLGADVATADDKPKDAAELCMGLVRLGTVFANSGRLEDYDMGIACHIIAVKKLVPLFT